MSENRMTDRAKKVIELSLREALQLGHNYIGTEHILLGLIREGEGTAAKVLETLGLGLDDVRKAVIHYLASPTTPKRGLRFSTTNAEGDAFAHGELILKVQGPHEEVLRLLQTWPGGVGDSE